MSLYSLRRLVITLILLVAAAVLRPAAAGLDDVYLGLLDWGPYLILGIVALLCAYTGVARVFTAALTLLVVYYLIQSRLQVTLLATDALIVYTGISLALPLIMLLLFLQRERGLWNQHGALTFSMIPVLLLAGGLLRYFVTDPVLLHIINDWLAPKPVDGYILSVNSSLLFAAALAAGVYRLCRYDSEHDVAVLAALLFGYVMLVRFDRAEISTLMLGFAGLAMLVSMMLSIHDMAYRDDLTGLLGRRALNQRLKGLGRRYSIAMMDVDHFKKFNDTYGHDTGDEVLKMVAKHIAGITGGGTAYRYGGEEFCVVFPGRDPDYCKPFLEAVRATIEKYELVVRDSKNRPESRKEAKERRGRRARNRGNKAVSVTVSIGLAAPDDKHTDVEEVLKAADQALYKAKQKGRNCLVSGADKK